ncbi:hypothetical protein HDU93_006212, partial [Gonapodya sp. JEL0774]
YRSSLGCHHTGSSQELLGRSHQEDDQRCSHSIQLGQRHTAARCVAFGAFLLLPSCQHRNARSGVRVRKQGWVHFQKDGQDEEGENSGSRRCGGGADKMGNRTRDGKHGDLRGYQGLLPLHTTSTDSQVSRDHRNTWSLALLLQAFPDSDCNARSPWRRQTSHASTRRVARSCVFSTGIRTYPVRDGCRRSPSNEGKHPCRSGRRRHLPMASSTSDIRRRIRRSEALPYSMWIGPERNQVRICFDTWRLNDRQFSET